MRPHGDPDGLATAGRMLVAAAAEMERIGDAVAGLGGDLAGPDGWQGQASAAYRAWDRLLEDGVGHAADALREAGAGVSELSARLAGAQALWDHAKSLAASAGLVLDPAADGPLALPFLSVDPRVATAARVTEIAREAAEQAASADRSAATRLAGAAMTAGRAVGATGAPAAAGHPSGEAEKPSLLARGLAVVDRIGVAVGAGLAAIEARAGALTRLVQSGREPAEGLAAVRALAALERTAFTDMLTAVLPLGGPAITLAANLAGAEGDEPLVRALVRSLGESLGADAGQRIGTAACGAETFATGGAGAFLCPAVAIATTSVGARLGGAAAVRIYDELGAEPAHHPATMARGSPP